MEDIIRSEEDLLGVGVQTYTSLSVILDYYMKIKMHGEGFAQWYKADDSTRINTNGYMSPVRVPAGAFQKNTSLVCCFSSGVWRQFYPQLKGTKRMSTASNHESPSRLDAASRLDVFLGQKGGARNNPAVAPTSGFN